MGLWKPEPEWQGQDAFLIGGGPSLNSFDFGTLKGANTIGCNDAYHLGSSVVKILLFGDASYFHRCKWDLEKFGGKVVTNAPTLTPLEIPWLLRMERVEEGWGTGSKLSWHASTGAAAINLAVSLGAARIFLLGYDMGVRNNNSHWHRHAVKTTTEETFQRFIKGFGAVAQELTKHPNVVVYNVTDGTSRLPYFPQVTFVDFERMRQ